MDDRTYRELRQVGKTIPDRWLKRAIKKGVPLKDGVKEYLDWQKSTTRFSSRDDQKKVNEIEKFYKQGAFNHESTTIDEAMEKKIEEHVAGKVKYLIDSGKIKPPKQDAWAKRITAKATKKV